MPECDLTFPLDRFLRHWDGHPRENSDNHHRHQQLDQAKTMNAGVFHGTMTGTSAPFPTETFCCESRIRKSVTRNTDSPLRAPRSNTSVARLPVPETGGAPGGLSIEIRAMPFSVSIRLTSAMICPSRLKNPPSVISRILSVPG